MLLLPDKNSFNGQSNSVSFSARMHCLANFYERVLANCTSIDVFIGNSGLEFSEFEKKSIHISDFSSVTNCLNTAVPPDLHLSINK